MKAYLAFLLAFFVFTAPAHAGSGFDEVMKTRTLRCAYASMPLLFTVDPATHEMSGALYDITNDIGKRLDIKVDWVEDVGYSDIAAGLNAGRYDAFCSVLWQTSGRASAMSFSEPLYKNMVHPCVRADSTAYDASADALNAPDKTLGAYDGDVSLQLAKNVFPKAKIMTFPSTTSWAEVLQSIVQKKIDAVATCDSVATDQFNASYRDKKAPLEGLVKLAGQEPITLVKVALALPLGDTRLKDMIDTAIYDMRADGTLEKIMRKYADPYIGNAIMIEPAYTQLPSKDTGAP